MRRCTFATRIASGMYTCLLVDIIAGQVGVDDILPAHRAIQLFLIKDVTLNELGLRRSVATELSGMAEKEWQLHLRSVRQHLDHPTDNLAASTKYQQVRHHSTSLLLDLDKRVAFLADLLRGESWFPCFDR
jgi:hypothetical protein